MSSIALLTVELPVYEVSKTGAVAMDNVWSWSEMLLGLWVLGMLVQSGLFYRQLRQLYSFLNNEEKGGSCTFLRRIRIDPALEGEARKKVSIHEQVHADQLHSLDLLWYSLLSIVFWFNPFFAIARAAIKDVHEYIADAHTNRLTDNYSNTLLASAFGISHLPIANEFNSINLKNRILMLKKERTRAQRNRIVGAIATVVLIATSVACTSIVEEMPNNKVKVHEKVDQMPRFSGCEGLGMIDEAIEKCAKEKLYEYMGTNINYPKSAQKEGIEGKVLVSYVIDEQGAVADVEIKESVDERLDAEALRVIESMPSWTPGVHEGTTVKVAMILPIMFKLDD
jgi:TonB family protein